MSTPTVTAGPPSADDRPHCLIFVVRRWVCRTIIGGLQRPWQRPSKKTAVDHPPGSPRIGENDPCERASSGRRSAWRSGRLLHRVSMTGTRTTRRKSKIPTTGASGVPKENESRTPPPSRRFEHIHLRREMYPYILLAKECGYEIEVRNNHPDARELAAPRISRNALERSDQADPLDSRATSPCRC